MSNTLHPALAAAAQLQFKKGEDYNGPNDNDPAKSQYFPFGHQSYLHMLHLKLERIKRVTIFNSSNTNFESAADSVLDLINYASFYYSFLMREEQSAKILQRQKLKEAEKQLNKAKTQLEAEDAEKAPTS